MILHLGLWAVGFLAVLFLFIATLADIVRNG